MRSPIWGLRASQMAAAVVWETPRDAESIQQRVRVVTLVLAITCLAAHGLGRAAFKVIACKICTAKAEQLRDMKCTFAAAFCPKDVCSSMPGIVMQVQQNLQT